ncbi:MAG TPA: AAA family ATPase, partial [Oligoflexus sp.]|uniref:protein kinase domain-containing protein n=1 Tax=Oligoflexus sp. TaxID=1971216 RepID=UPI002D73595C
MEKLGKYQIVETLHSSSPNVVYVCMEPDAGEEVVLKVVPDRHNNSLASLRLEQEFSFIHTLNGAYFLKAFDLIKEADRIYIVMERFRGLSLRRHLPERKSPLEIEQIFSLAISMVEAIDHVHDKLIIHKDISPDNILVSDDLKEIRLIDFGISTLLSREHPKVEHLSQLEGHFQYIAPEQTGRMNRSLDYRCDYYSLGALLYELVSGEPPFPTDDPLACVSAHISEMRRPPHAPGREVPPALSEIILKLLSKGAEDRYQSGFGLIADLKEAQKRWAAGERQSRFPLATRDVPRYFAVSQKYYGREKEIRLLEEAFEKVFSSKQAQMILVTGASGIGKTTLINEVHKPLLRQRGLFIKGKFNQYSRDIPYEAFISAFSSLADHFLALPEAQLVKIREGLLKTLGHNARVAVDLIPRFGAVLGELPELEDLGSVGNANRFRLALDAIVTAIVQNEYPLVIFIDDLQWADGGSLGLIQNIFERREGAQLFLIGAYRDNEVDQLHPLTRCLQNLMDMGLDIARAGLNPLSELDLAGLIADSLYSSPVETKDICEEVMHKTHGNPFFVHEVLTQLYHAKAFNFSAQLGRWQWDINNIRALGLSSNVIDFLIVKIKNLGAEVIPLLAHAACIGHEFDLKTLCALSGVGLQEASMILAGPCQEHILIYEGPSFLFQHASSEDRPSDTFDEIKYRFVHDRVQQACHALLPETDIKKIKLQYGRYLLRNSSGEDVQKNLVVQIAELFNSGFDYIETSSEQSLVVDLNLMAAKKSAASLSYGSAVKLARLGLQILQSVNKDDQGDRWRALMLTLAEAEYHNHNVKVSEQLFESLLSTGGDPFSMAQVYKKKTALYGLTGEHEKACMSGIEGLRLLGIDLPLKPHIAHGVFECLRSLYLAGKLRKSGQLVETLMSPPVEDEKHKLTVALFIAIQFNAFQYNINLFTLVNAYPIRLLLMNGNTEGASGLYQNLALLTILINRDYQHAAALTELGIEFAKKYESKGTVGATLLSYAFCLLPWAKDLRETTARIATAEDFLIQAGEIDRLDSARAIRLYFTMHCAPYIQDIAKMAREMEGVTRQKTLRDAAPCYAMTQQYLRVMTGVTPDILTYRAEDKWDKDAVDMVMQKVPGITSTTNFSILQSQSFLIFNQYERALPLLLACELNKIVGCATVAYHNFFLGLSASALHQRQLMGSYQCGKRLRSTLKKARTWASVVPVNFKHFALVLEAEFQLFKGQYLKAAAFYDEAISTAEQSSYFWVAGLAADRCAEMYLGLKQRRVAELYLKMAYGFYQTYGATGKLQQLLANHPDVFRKTSHSQIAGVVNKTLHGRTITQPEGQTTYQHGDVLDVTAITRAAQAISGSIRIDDLLSKLLAILRQTAGGNRCVLLLPMKEGSESSWQVMAQSIDSNDPKLMLHVPYQESPHLCTAICEYVMRSRLPLVLGDPGREGAYTQNSYVKEQRPQSILCMPIISRNNPVALIYLENSTSTHAFTSERIELITTLGSQAAISIENALLYAGMEKQVEERTAKLNEKTLEVRSILQNIELGIFTVGLSSDRSKIIIDQEHSVYLKSILEMENPGGRELSEILKKTSLGEDQQAGLVSAINAMMGEDALIREMNEHFLSKEFELLFADGRHKIIEIDWGFIYSDSLTLQKILVSLRDVTRLKALQLEVEAHKEELEIIGQVLDITLPKFKLFAERANQYLQENRKILVRRTASEELLNILYRNLHTLKGLCRNYKMMRLADLVHKAEETLSVVRGAPDAKWDFERMEADLAAAESILFKYSDVINRKLGFGADKMFPSDGLETVAGLTAALRETLPSMAQSLGKNPPQIHIEGGHILLSRENSELMEGVLTHCLRNSIDHGIEAPEDRAKAGKDEVGKINVVVEEEPESYLVRIRD